MWLNIGSGNGLLLDSTKPLPEPVLTYHRLCPVTFIWGLFTWDTSAIDLKNHLFNLSFKSPSGLWFDLRNTHWSDMFHHVHLLLYLSNLICVTPTKHVFFLIYSYHFILFALRRLKLHIFPFAKSLMITAHFKCYVSCDQMLRLHSSSKFCSNTLLKHMEINSQVYFLHFIFTHFISFV